jgi:DNA-binding CsgD family transcriptional regulator/tetratricopeptide (TPR) repeat protein
MGLLERESDLLHLQSWLSEVAGGGGRIAFVFGEAGIGKTSLLQEFAGGRQDGANRALWGTCEALFTPHPLAPLYDIARQVGGEFAAAIAAASNREAAFNLTADHLAQRPKPTVLIFEDVHWADEATLDLIKFLGRRSQRLGTMLVVSYRDDEVGARHPLRSVIGDLPAAFLRRLQPAPLTADAVAALLAAEGRFDARLQAATLHAITGGNPFFVTEALAMTELSAMRGAVPPTVRDAVIARLSRISDAARSIVNLTPLVPGRIERWLLDALGVEAGAIPECVAVGMRAFPDGALAFRHELARRAVEGHLPVSQQRELHARILKALLESTAEPVSPARLIHHAEQAGDRDTVLRLAPVAADRAASLGAHREAAAHYSSALRHAAAMPEESRAALFERQSYECYLTEQIPEAIEAREAALALWRRTGARVKEGDALRWLSRLAWSNGQKAAAEKYAVEAVAILEPLDPGPELAMAYSNRAQLHMLAGDAPFALQWGGKAIDLATNLNDRATLSHALNNVGTAKMVNLDASGRGDLLRSLQLALDGGFPEHAARAYTNLSSSSVRMRDFETARRYLAEGIAYCEDRDLDFWTRYMTTFRAIAHLAHGDWDKAAEDAQAVIQNPGAATISRIPALIALGLVRARRGDRDVDALLAEARDLALPTGEIQRIGPAIAARAEAAWIKGELSPDSPEAEELRSAYAVARTMSEPWLRSELAFWRWRCGGVAETAAEAVTPFARQMVGDWRGAASAWQRLGCPYEEAVALADSREETALRQALAIFERLDGCPLAAIVRRKLRAGGVRGIARGAQERTRRNPLGLTARELGVLAHLVEGRRNAEIARRLFVSEKTVDHHVSAILGKLGVRSRGEAAAMASRLGLIEQKNVAVTTKK